jgi:hypothetical protein
MWLLLRLQICVLLLAASEFAMAVAEPPFAVSISDAPFEVRDYPGFIVAETWVEGDFDAAGRAGFRRIANYIFGDNIAQGGASAKIAMTAPVTMEPASEKIAMTAPVTMEAEGQRWRMHFVMPAGYTLATLPRPKDPLITLREVPAHRVAVVRFSGFTTQKGMIEQTAKLQAWMRARGLESAAAPQIARYNDPFTLPWNRRNEMMLRVE